MDLLTANEIEDPTLRKIVKANSEYEAGFIYSMMCRRFVKVGFATDVYQRLANIRTSTPYDVTLEHTFPGTREDERKLHKALKAAHYKGEWFWNTDDADDLFDLIYDYQWDVLYHTLRDRSTTGDKLLAMQADVPLCGFWTWRDKMVEIGRV